MTDTATPNRQIDKMDAAAWGALFVLSGAIFLDALDVSMVGVALPSIREDLGLSTTSLQWIVSAYVLGYGGLLLLGGRVADLLGRRRVFIWSVAVFLVASALGGLVNDGSLLIATRFIKGIAAAFTVPAGLSIITTTFAEGPARNKALSIYTATAASGWSLGLVFGGALTEIGWRWTFFLPVPIALAILLAAPRFLGRDERSERRWQGLRAFDVPGAAAISAAMLLLVYTVVEAPSEGWGSPRTLLSFAGVAALMAAFVAIEQRTSEPLVRLGILRSGSLRRANLGAMAVVGAWFGVQFITTLYFQQLRGWSAIETALAFLPAGILVSVGAPYAGRIVDRFGTTRPITVGMLAFVVGYLLFLGIDIDSAYATAILPTILLAGRRVHARLRAAQHGRHLGRRESRAGPRIRPREHVVPGGRSDRARDRHRGDQRGRGGLGCPRRKHPRAARRLPGGPDRLGDRGPVRPGRDALGTGAREVAGPPGVLARRRGRRLRRAERRPQAASCSTVSACGAGFENTIAPSSSAPRRSARMSRA